MCVCECVLCGDVHKIDGKITRVFYVNDICGKYVCVHTRYVRKFVQNILRHIRVPQFFTVCFCASILPTHSRLLLSVPRVVISYN